LSAADCGVLVDKISSKIDFWLAKKLSFAWRLQLIMAVLYSILSFWWGFFVLPKKIVKILEQKFNRNLWSGSDSCKAKVKVAWELVCLPKTEGGLGLKRIEDWNRAAMMSHIWNILAKAGSLWVASVREHLLKGKSFWRIKIPHMSSWCWKKLLKLREVAQHFIHFKVRDGTKFIFGLISGTRMVAYMQRMDIGWCINWIVRLMQTVFYEYVQKLVLAPS
jgi:hypothetical protein